MAFLAAPRSDRIDAPWMIDGPINGERFRHYVEKVLILTLKPGDIVVMDNLAAHKMVSTGQAIEAAGHIKAIGRPSRSLLVWVLVVGPPRERPVAWAQAPLLLSWAAP